MSWFLENLNPNGIFSGKMLKCDVLMYAQHSDGIGQCPEKQRYMGSGLGFYFPEITLTSFNTESASGLHM